MADQHELIAALAGSAEVAAAVGSVAAGVRDRAAAIDHEGDFVLEDAELVVNGLGRRVTLVRNVTPTATAREFGPRGPRALGRAARSS